MERLLILAAVLLAAAVGVFLILGGNQAPTPAVQPTHPVDTVPEAQPLVSGLPLRSEGQAKTYTVLMRNEGGQFFFDPVALRVLPGDTVVWLNLGDNHSTTAYAPPNTKAGGTAVPQRIPEGAQAWDSGILGLQDRGLTFSHTFKVPGTYDYYCFPHEFLGMVGRVVVDVPGGPGESDDFANLSEASVQQLQALNSADITSASGTRFNWAAEINTVLLKVFEKDNAAAIAQAQALLEHAPQAAVALGTDAVLFQSLLQDYASLAAEAAGFGAFSAKADELKDLLNHAR